MTIGEVAKKFKISPRMLRYYDSIGLLPCLREEGNDYRLYDENAVMRLQQILVLRSLRISFKKIALVLEHPDSMAQVIDETLQETNMELETLHPSGKHFVCASSRLRAHSGRRCFPLFPHVKGRESSLHCLVPQIITRRKLS